MEYFDKAVSIKSNSVKKNINLLKEQDFDEIESYLSEKFDDILVTLKLFTTIIDSHPDLTNVWKLQHFRCLTDTALETIRSLEITDRSFTDYLIGIWFFRRMPGAMSTPEWLWFNSSWPVG